MSKAVTRWCREVQVIPIQEQTGVEEDQLVAKMLLLQVHTLVRLSQQSISLALIHGNSQVIFLWHMWTY